MGFQHEVILAIAPGILPSNFTNLSQKLKSFGYAHTYTHDRRLVVVAH